MKKFVLTSILTFLLILSYSQSCLPEGIIFTTQSQIDSFSINYPGCTRIDGYLIIRGDDITDLTGLSVLNKIGDSLRIESNNALKSLIGLDNLTSIGSSLYIRNNDALTSLTGLNNLTSIGNHVFIWNNDALDSLTGMDKMTSIGGGLLIIANDALASLTGLDNLTSIGGHLIISLNGKLTSLEGLDNLTSIGSYLQINNNSELTSLKGLDNLTSIGSDLTINLNFALSSLAGLEKLTSIGGHLWIIYNSELTSLKELDKLTSIGGGLWIIDNHALVSLTGLENIDDSTINDLDIIDNNNLSACHVHSICEYIADPIGFVNIYDNAMGCSSPEEVQDSCEAHAGYIDIDINEDDIIIYPNPANKELTISIEGFTFEGVVFYNLTGQKVHAIRPKSETIDISHLQPGMYIVEVTVENRKVRQKLLVQR